MTQAEIRTLLGRLTETSASLENLYIDNDGEVTDETVELEGQRDAIAALLNSDGIDSLGRWLKAKQDEIKTLKAEKDYISRRIKSVENTIDYILQNITEVMKATGCEKAKGSLGYTFTAYQSVTTSVDKDVLKSRYERKIREILEDNEIPSYITFTLGASATEAKTYAEDELLPEEDAEIFVTTIKDATRFTKPRGNKE